MAPRHRCSFVTTPWSACLRDCPCPIIAMTSSSREACSWQLDRSDEVIDLLAQSEMMEGHWSRYQAANAFAESVSWQDALASLRALANAVKDAKTAD